jgi:hypothetical protein
MHKICKISRNKIITTTFNSITDKNMDKKQLQDNIKKFQLELKKLQQEAMPNNLLKQANETYLEAASRRLKGAKNIRDYFSVIIAIKKEVIPQIPDIVMKIVAVIKGDNLPPNIKMCRWFNTGHCTKDCIHTEGSSTKSPGRLFMHCCELCRVLLGIGAHHPAIQCTVLARLDNISQDVDDPFGLPPYIPKTPPFPPPPPPQTESPKESIYIPTKISE